MKLKKSEQVDGAGSLISYNVQSFLQLKEEMEELEAKMEPIKKFITDFVNNVEANNKGQKILDIEGLAKCMLIIATRENFSIKQAKEKYSEDQFKQFIAPYLSVSSFPKLTVTAEKE
jgi:hypothetical protein